jgi:DNA modification methylase
MRAKRRKLRYSLELGNMATFSGNIKLPVYNWFHYKEAFSRALVLEIIRVFNLNKGNTVLDPFCGAGTTLLACRESGIDSIGFDILPISVFSTKVKVTDYNADVLKKTAKKLFKKRFEFAEAGIPDFIRRYFSKDVLNDIIFFIKQIEGIEEPDIKHFFKLALINAAIKASYSFKDGRYLKFRKKRVKPLRPVFRSVVYRMIKDIKTFRSSGCPKSAVSFGDARRLPLRSQSADAVITSPPYLGQTDYQTVYRLENFFVGRDVGGSFIGENKEKNILSVEVPKEAAAYFCDMHTALKEMFRVCKNGGKAGIVVGNGFISGRVVEADLLLSEMAEGAGFSVRDIFVLNERFALKDRTKKIGVLRESLIVLEK